jgi:Flp pilus assembly protein TadD
MRARALLASGRPSESLACLEQASRRWPDDEALQRAFAAALARADQVAPALDIADRWSASSWAAPFALNLLAEHGRHDGAARYEAAVAAAAPADIGLLECRARRLRGDPPALLRLSEDVLAAAPGASHALYYRAVALAQLGRAAEATEAMAVDRFLPVSR